MGPLRRVERLDWVGLATGPLMLKKFLKRDRKASLKESTIEDCALNDYCYACGGCDKGDPYNREKGPDGKRLVALEAQRDAHVDTALHRRLFHQYIFRSLKNVAPWRPHRLPHKVDNV